MESRDDIPHRPAPPTADEVPHERILLACLTMATMYCAVAVVLLELRFEFHRFGVRISPGVLPAWRWAWWMHVGGALLGLVLLILARLTHVRRPLAGRIVLAAMPLLLLVSIDQLLAVTVKPIPADGGRFCAHPRRGWSLRPGWRSPDGPEVLRINRVGFRGPKLPAEKATDERRVLLLGDSVTFGEYVLEQASFASLLQHRFDDRRTAGRTTVVNASVPAYSPWQELDLFTHEGLQSQPDVVVLVCCLNDVLEKFRMARFGGSTRGFEPPTPSVLEWSGLFRVARAWRGEMFRPTTSEFEQDRVAYRFSKLWDDRAADQVRKGWDITLENMSRIVEAARRESLPIAMVCAPASEQFGHPTTHGPQSILEAFAIEQGVPFLDLLPGFAAYSKENNIDIATLFYDPLHFSADGHRIAAELIDDMLVRLGWVE